MNLQFVVRRLLSLGYRVQVHGKEHVPARGPVILAANHTGWIDGPMLAFAADRQLRVLAKHELWNGPFRKIVSAGEGIPIDWRRADRNALLEARSVLAAAGAVGIFPEGTRCRGDFSWLRDGVSYLLSHNVAPVVPVAILGTRRTGESRDSLPKLGSRIVVAVGAPIAHEELFQGGDLRRRETSRRIGERLRPLLEDHVARCAVQYELPLPDDDVSRREDHER